MSHPHLSAVERARRYLIALPAAESGQRGHDATFRAACALYHGFGLSQDVTYALISAEFNPRCQPPWSAGELAHKVGDAATAASTKPRGYLLGDGDHSSDMPLPGAPSRWPKSNSDTIRRITNSGPTALQLWELSPVRLDVDDGSNCEEIIRTLFTSPSSSDPLLCVGKSKSEFATRPLSRWLSCGRLADFSLVVPSPMSARTGRTKDGRESEHTLENTGPRRYLPVEFDEGTVDDHAARLWHLAEFAPLAVVVHSGGRSLHGWFYCDGQPEDALRKTMIYAVSLGADKATWTRSQFVRMPAGQRDNGCRQSVFYFDPAASSNQEVAANG